MITLIGEKFKDILPEEFNKYCEERLKLNELPCSCGQSGTFIRYGYYRRWYITKLAYISAKSSFPRVRCKHCGKTHAILPCGIVPYLQLSLEIQKNMITHEINDDVIQSSMDSNPDKIDINRFYRVICRFKKYWRIKLIAMTLNLEKLKNISIPDLSLLSFKHFNYQFLQIRRGNCLYFMPPT